MDREARCCRRKIRYGNPVAALQAFIHMASIDSDAQIHIYECEVCQGFHLGGMRPSRVLKIQNNNRNRHIIWRLFQK